MNPHKPSEKNNKNPAHPTSELVTKQVQKLYIPKSVRHKAQTECECTTVSKSRAGFTSKHQTRAHSKESLKYRRRKSHLSHRSTLRKLFTPKINIPHRQSSEETPTDESEGWGSSDFPSSSSSTNDHSPSFYTYVDRIPYNKSSSSPSDTVVLRRPILVRSSRQKTNIRSLQPTSLHRRGQIQSRYSSNSHSSMIGASGDCKTSLGSQSAKSQPRKPEGQCTENSSRLFARRSQEDCSQSPKIRSRTASNLSRSLSQLVKGEENEDSETGVANKIRGYGNSRSSQQASLNKKPTSSVNGQKYPLKITQIGPACDAKILPFLETKKKSKITVCVRKRPRNRKELMAGDIDILSVPASDHIVICEPRQRFDLTEYLDHTTFRFDRCFDENATTAEVYKHTAAPMIHSIFRGYMATCFAYGQTGSGKTFTMGGPRSSASDLPMVERGIYGMTVIDLFRLYEESKFRNELTISVNFFEIYCNKVYDLLNKKHQLRVMEDSYGAVQMLGLREYVVEDVKTTLVLLRQGHQLRTNGQTMANENSSRSHAVFQINVRQRTLEELRRMCRRSEDDSEVVAYPHVTSTLASYPSVHQSGPLIGRFSLVDLAGNERSVDSASTRDRTRHLESGEINKSLLALKECIRAMGNNTTCYLPFRTSKLTQVLRESFVGNRSRTCMIAMVSPGLSCCEHTMNTLRYAQRVKHLTPHPIIDRSSYVITCYGEPSEVETEGKDDSSPNEMSAHLKNQDADHTDQQEEDDGTDDEEEILNQTRTCEESPKTSPQTSRSLPRERHKEKSEEPASSSGDLPSDKSPKNYLSLQRNREKSISCEKPAVSQESEEEKLTEWEYVGIDVKPRCCSKKEGDTKSEDGRRSAHTHKSKECEKDISARDPPKTKRHNLVRLHQQRVDVVRRHKALVKNLPQWITEHRRLLQKANQEKTNMMAYVTSLTSRLTRDIRELKHIQDDALLLRSMHTNSI
ncbi:unnamed protein product [Calicophoron daubneyi]|uniref:Kinesin-like protein n=1 Tax=Calicophoron daubneyi TaxID=300641 RepID=A0AAV2TGH5_CALDB